MGVRLIGVPFNSSGTADGVARAPAALRRAGLAARLGAGDGGDVRVEGLVELYLALGLPSEGLPEELAALLPLLAPSQVRLLGPRDHAVIVGDGVASLLQPRPRPRRRPGRPRGRLPGRDATHPPVGG
jgi:hypothetical protein